MLLYELTALAQEDLKEIARYTLTQWSEKQSLHYAELLEKRFCEIAARTAYSRPLSIRYPQVLVSRCENHYIFYIHQERKPPRIIAILHERMNILKRLKNRFD
jgi:plasmid stabilization system protein ParE